MIFSVLKRKTIISSIPMCYAKHHNVHGFHFKSYLCWQIVSYWQLTDVTHWDLQASSLGPLQIVYVTLNTINNVVRWLWVGRKILTKSNKLWKEMNFPYHEGLLMLPGSSDWPYWRHGHAIRSQKCPCHNSWAFSKPFPPPLFILHSEMIKVYDILVNKPKNFIH